MDSYQGGDLIFDSKTSYIVYTDLVDGDGI